MQMQAVLDEASAAINVMLHIVDGAAALLDHDNVTPVYRAIKTWLCCGVGGSLYIQWAAMLGLAAAAWVGLAAALLQLRALDGLSGEDHERSTLSRHLWRAWHCVCVRVCLCVAAHICLCISGSPRTTTSTRSATPHRAATIPLQIAVVLQTATAPATTLLARRRRRHRRHLCQRTWPLSRVVVVLSAQVERL